jgi:putative flavoprotein involved in K+ transport
MPRDSIVGLLEEYARAVEAPVREGVDVTSMDLDPGGGLLVRTSAGDLQATAVVLATGAYQRPHRPVGAETLPVGLLQLDVEDYRNEHELPPGKVLVVGSGQSGCQIAEELREAGREVVLACGRAPWVPRRIGGHDLLWWAHETGFLDATIESLPAPEARLFANVVATGHGGGHDLHLRTLHEQGVVLAGHFLGVADGHVQFASDLHESVAWGDERHGQFMTLVYELASDRGLDRPLLDELTPLECEPPTRVTLSEFGSVIFAGGFRPDYRSWLPWPEAFDDHGFPVHQDGASTVVPGLYFVGVHFLRKRKSSLLIGVGEDAEIVAHQIAAWRS